MADALLICSLFFFAAGAVSGALVTFIFYGSYVRRAAYEDAREAMRVAVEMSAAKDRFDVAEAGRRAMRQMDANRAALTRTEGKTNG